MPHLPDVLDHRRAANAQPSARSGALAQVASSVAAAAPGIAVMPALAVAGSPVDASPLQCVVAAVIALVSFFIAARLARGVILIVLGIFSASVAAWLLAQASYPVAAWIIAPALGAGAGAAGGRPWPRRGDDPASQTYRAILLPAPFAAAGALALARFAGGRDAAMAIGAASVAVAGALRVAAASGRGGRALAIAPLAALLVLLPSGTAAYIGATTPRVTWFGALTSHGPRDGDEVAITFDDGPDPPYTLEIAAILDAHGAKGTFFTVGKALDARPDVSKALMEDGHLLGNHSYRHDAVRWLDPRYPELQKTQDAFERNLGVCPAFYRPPHGSHTPFMAHVVADHGMTMITWDDSAGDWATGDGDLVARRILDGVKPGSIILLHDGIDGNIGADRTVVLRALPIILDGLKARGLRPVTLDRLLGKPGYVPC